MRGFSSGGRAVHVESPQITNRVRFLLREPCRQASLVGVSFKCIASWSWSFWLQPSGFVHLVDKAMAVLQPRRPRWDETRWKWIQKAACEPGQRWCCSFPSWPCLPDFPDRKKLGTSASYVQLSSFTSSIQVTQAWTLEKSWSQVVAAAAWFSWIWPAEHSAAEASLRALE